MLDYLLRHQSELRLVGTVTAFIAAAYKFFVPPSTQRKNHEGLTRLAKWAADSGWLNVLQSGVGWILNVMTVVYGSPREAGSLRPSKFMTVRAWRMSAWIASMYILVFSPLSVALIISIGENDITHSALLAGLIGAISLFLHIRLLPTVRASDSGVQSKQLALIFLRGLAIGVVLLAISFILFASTTLSSTAPSHLQPTLGPTLFVLVVGALVIFLFVRAIAAFGFYAPLIVSAQWFLILLLVLNPVLAFVELLGLLGLAPSDRSSFWTLPHLIILFASTSLLFFSCMQFFIRGRKALSLATSTLLLAVGLTALLAILGMNSTNSNSQLNIIAVGAFAGFAISALIMPYVIFFYGAVFANSIPDWLSVGLTRTIFTRAAESRRLSSFLMWLLADIAAVIGCMVLSLIVASVAMLLAYVLIHEGKEFAGSLANLNIKYSDSELNEPFFRGGAFVVIVPYEIAIHGFQNAQHVMKDWGHGGGRDGAFTVLGMALLGSPAVIPPILNALVLVGLIVGRISAYALAAPFKYLHTFLLLPEDASPERMAVSLFRSAGIFGFLGAVACVGVLMIIRGIK